MKRCRTDILSAALGGLFAVIILFLFVPAPVHGQGHPVLTRHVREVVSNNEAKRVGQLPETQTLQLNIA